MCWNVPVEMGIRETKIAKRLQRVGRFCGFRRENSSDLCR